MTEQASKELRARPIVARLRGELEQRCHELSDKLGRQPALAILRVGEREDDRYYSQALPKRAQSIGARVHEFVLPANAAEADAAALIELINADAGIDGALLMRPFPKGWNERALCEQIDPDKDLEGVGSAAMAALYAGRHGFAPCTAEACVLLLKEYGIELAGKRVLIVGRSLVVGRPLAMLLLEEDATVSIAHSKSQDLEQLAAHADILVAALGRQRFIERRHMHSGLILLDVGIHEAEDGELCGDVNERDARALGLTYSPVPGGVGGLTSILMMEHLIRAAAGRLGMD